MATRLEILAAIRQLRNDIFARRKNHTDAREKLRYQCDRIRDLAVDGKDWSSVEMPDPLIRGERGHSVRVVRTRGKSGVIVSLTGSRKILGNVRDVTDSESTRNDLERATGARGWREKTDVFK